MPPGLGRPLGTPDQCHPLSYLYSSAIRFGAGVHQDFSPHWYGSTASGRGKRPLYICPLYAR
jgi:hypothetical protein